MELETYLEATLASKIIHSKRACFWCTHTHTHIIDAHLSFCFVGPWFLARSLKCEKSTHRGREREKWAFEEKFVHTFRKKESCFGFIKMPFANHPQLWVLGLNQFYKWSPNFHHHVVVVVVVDDDDNSPAGWSNLWSFYSEWWNDPVLVCGTFVFLFQWLFALAPGSPHTYLDSFKPLFGLVG
jgi:hypothetical protein